jgi:hypothetical protein
MGDEDRPKTKVTDAGKAKQPDREAQRAEALRANLLRRKSQGRARADEAETAKKPGDA